MMFNIIMLGFEIQTMFAQAATPAEPATPIWLIIVLAVLGSSALAALINVLFNRSKTKSESEKMDADAADVITRASTELIKNVEAHYKANEANMMAQIKEQSLKIDALSLEVSKIPELQKSISELTKGIEVLTAQLLEHDINPVYPPIPPSF